jgi:pyruvate,water dikinase
VSAVAVGVDAARAVLDEETARGAEPGRLGGKATGLLRLRELGLDVPPFCVVAADEFRSHLRTGAIPDALGRVALACADGESPSSPRVRDALADLRAAIEREPLETRLEAAIGVAVERLGGASYAVRSSMVGEDSARRSFAGQLDSHLFVPDAETVAAAVRRCWSSAYSERATAYGGDGGAGPAEVRMAVVIQRMVDADVAGVLFTSNPISGRRDESLVSAAYGCGEGVVSGRCDADEYVWSPAEGERSATVADKATRIVRQEAGDGTTQAPVRPEDRRRRALTPEQVEELCVAGTDVAEAAGRPMDIEWCYEDGRLHLLQARPVTTTRPQSGGGARLVLDNANIQESYSGVTTPLTFSFASRAYTTSFGLFARLLGVSRATLDEFQPHARTLLAFVHGRVYYNLASWYRLLALLPSFERNKESVEKVMLQLGDSVEVELGGERSLRRSVRRRFELLVAGSRLVLRFARLDSEVRRFTEHFEAVHASVDRDRLRDASLPELHATVSRLYAELLERWDTPNINDFRVMMACGRLRRLLARTHGEDEAQARLADLLGGIEGIESAAPTLLLIELAASAREDAELARALAEGEPARALRDVRRRFPGFAARIDAYTKRYGDRSMGELKLETQSLRDDPSFVVEVLRNYLSAEVDSDELVRRERERFATTFDELRRRSGPWTRLWLRRRVERARRAVEARESLRLLRTRAFGLARDIYGAMGRRLHEAGVLDDPRDVLYLTVDELEAFQEARAVSVDLAAIVAARKREFARYAEGTAPNRIETVGSPYLAPSAAEAAPDFDAGAVLLRGVGCSPGVVEAPVRVVLGRDDDLSVNGTILCTIRTDPGWAPLFPSVRGLVVERGSVLSHSAVVARELGVPTVVGVEHATRILRDGELVRLDGQAGTVERVEEAPAGGATR